MQGDPRILTAVTFEAELYTKYTLRCLTWSKAKSSIGCVNNKSPRTRPTLFICFPAAPPVQLCLFRLLPHQVRLRL